MTTCPRQSLWLRNIQLSVFGIIMGLITAAMNDGAVIYAKGFFQYYNSITWLAIVLQAFGGLVIAAVIKCVLPLI